MRYARLRVPHELRMGLARLEDDASWLELDDAWLDDLRAKRRLLREHRPQVFVERSDSRPAQTEVLDTVVAWLARRAPDRVRVVGADGAAPGAGWRRVEIPALGEVHARGGALAPLDLAARLVQEDLCVMERRRGAWRLTAASVCFPTRWDLPSKLDLPLAGIHAPVPGYAGRLERSADRFFEAMPAGPITWRSNWSLLDDDALFQPAGSGRTAANPAVCAENAGERVWLRVERQTLRRLPRSDAILFTIRVHQSRLEALAREPERARALAGAVRTMPADLGDYKSLPAVRDAVVAYLEERVGAGEGVGR